MLGSERLVLLRQLNVLYGLINRIGTDRRYADAFEIECSRYPTTQEGIQALVQQPADLEEEWKGPYLKRGVPKDPWRNPYVYRYPGRQRC